MERMEVIAQAARALRSHALAMRTWDDVPHARVVLRLLCEMRCIEISPQATTNGVLGGAYARLQLFDWDTPQEGVIHLRAGLSQEQELFAIAHELGHYVLHRGELAAREEACEEDEVNETPDTSGLRIEPHRVEEYTPRARRELEANAFAAELLAPCAEVRRCFTASALSDAVTLARRFGISTPLMRQRLVDAVLSALKPDTVPPAAETSAPMPGEPSELLSALDDSQRAAARTSGPALIVAGPGTGKTKTLVGRAAYLLLECGERPESILALTFSNRAAGEMRERLSLHDLHGERMPVMTIHALAATLLREFATQAPHAPDEPPLTPDFRILDRADALLLMEDLLAELPLRFYRSLGNPTRHLTTLLDDFSRARDELHTPDGYLALVATMQSAPEPLHDANAGTKRKNKPKQEIPEGTYSKDQIDKAHERALAYGVWDRALHRRGLVDFGGLIQRAVEMLHARPAVLAEVRQRYRNILVDEFQDTNRAAGELLLLLAGDTGAGLWVVGDRNQSIYRWRGASPANLSLLRQHYPALHVHTLRYCYRSVPGIVAMGSTMAARMAELAPDPSALAQPVALVPVRSAIADPAVLRCEAYPTAAAEGVGLAATIAQRHAAGTSYRDQAVLCRSNKQVAALATALAENEIPVSQQGNFFARPEVKDILALLALATGPDCRGLLRVDALLADLGHVPPGPREHALLIREAVAMHEAMPRGLATLPARLAGIAQIRDETRLGLGTLANVVTKLRYGPRVSDQLASFLLRPRGYAWALACVADGLPLPTNMSSMFIPSPALAHAGQARAALAALGELVRLAARFDSRWAREEDFRARLIRAVRHSAPAPQASISAAVPSSAFPAADALELPPDADVAPTTAGTPAIAADTESASAASCFLHYLGALRLAEAEISVPASDPNAVAVLTIHASKGLEFPVVYLPRLAQGQFPTRNNRRPDPAPPGFHVDDTADADGDDDRCLFYVGVTRARDTVVLTRALHYGKSAAAPSRLLSLLDEAPAYQNAPSPHSDDAMALLAAPDNESDEEDSEEDESNDEYGGTLPPEMNTQRDVKPTHSLHALEQYIGCPRQYKYAHDYGLLDPTENAVYRFHRYVRHGIRDLRALCEAAPQATWQDAEVHLRASWQTDGPAGHAYDAYYWRHAEAILREEWQRLTAEREADTRERVTLAHDLYANLTACRVKLTADRLVHTDPTRPADAEVLLVQLHTGRPSPDHYEKDMDPALYYLAYHQFHPQAPIKIALAYVGNALADETPDGSPGGLLDVTEKAQKDAERYLKAVQGKGTSRLQKLDAAALGIEQKRFAPKVGGHCAACAFRDVCPADPDEAPNEASAVPAHPVPVVADYVRAHV
ncbi:MAG: ATP-dependent DNA helicase UvrD/PcrA [Ktedonobacterales bacterium]|jgi:superfamily I DNA/RNA helicase/Zn-dependent peptidase ImmA (M78 family)|nr:MAG: ATP-dependent DNA helicase UvrD/PcrA [Ktedonobacterales bacterium]